MRTFNARLSALLTDNRSDRWVSRKRAGKLDMRRLARIAFSSKLFKRKEEIQGKAYHVCLLVDASGSMHGKKQEQAAEAAILIGRSLAALGIQYEIAAFNTASYILRPFSADAMLPKEEEELRRDIKALVDSTQSATRLPVGLYQVRSKDMRTDIAVMADGRSAVEKRYPGHYISRMGAGADYNVDGKAFQEAAARLMAQGYGKKILIVLSDGQPVAGTLTTMQCGDRRDGKFYGDFDLSTEVSRALREGVAVCSVGIGTDAVYDYYPRRNTAVIYDAADIYKTLLKLLSENIKRRE